MDECSCDKDSSAKMAGKEEEVMWHREVRESSDEDGKGTCYISVSVSLKSE